MSDTLKYGVFLHLLIFILAFTGILGKLISTSAYVLVFYRLMIAVVALWIWLKFRKIKFNIPKQDRIKILLTGFVIGLHWYCFFESIKQSTVSIGLIALSTATIFAAVLEPFFFKRKLRYYEVIFGILTISGMFIVFNYESGYTSGLIIGCLAAFFGALFTVLNGMFIKKYSATAITFYEVLGGFSLLSVMLLFNPQHWYQLYLGWSDFGYLLFLGIVCTAMAFIGSVEVMKHISPFTVTLSFNLEPVYGIILALLIFGEAEQMSPQFYMGSVLILITIFTNAWLKHIIRKREKRKNEVAINAKVLQ